MGPRYSDRTLTCRQAVTSRQVPSSPALYRTSLTIYAPTRHTPTRYFLPSRSAPFRIGTPANPVRERNHRALSVTPRNALGRTRQTQCPFLQVHQRQHNRCPLYGRYRTRSPSLGRIQSDCSQRLLIRYGLLRSVYLAEVRTHPHTRATRAGISRPTSAKIYKQFIRNINHLSLTPPNNFPFAQPHIY